MILPVRFMDKVIPVTECGCWIWMGALNHRGYGRVMNEGKASAAHRVAYLKLVGEIDDGLHLDHLCRIRCCVNPDHLEPVTIAVNNVRSWRARGKKTHCKNGHPRTQPGSCRICDIERTKRLELRPHINTLARAAYHRRKGNHA